MALRRNRLRLSFTAGIAAVAVAGLTVSLAHRDGFPDSDLRRLISQRSFPLNEPVSFEGCIVKESETRGIDSVATVQLSAFLRNGRWVPCKGKGILRAALPERETHPDIGMLRGDRVKGWAKWNVPRNYENPGLPDTAGLLERRGIYLTGRAKSFRLLEVVPGGCTDPWTTAANSIAARVHRSLDPIREMGKGQTAAILASLTIGDYSRLDNATREIFQNSGTFHVLVVSGLHVAWIAGVIFQLCKLIRMPDRLRYLMAFLVILLYTCVVGFEASITRCLWMFLLYLTGRILFRRADPVNILMASAFLLLAANPYWLFEAGFQLSFISVLAIAMTAIPAVQKFVKPVCDPLLHSGRPDRLFLQPGRYYRCGRSLRIRCELFAEEIADRLSPAASHLLLWGVRVVSAAGFSVASMIVTSLAVQIWLEPLLAYYFNRMSWISPIANIAIVPFSSAVLSAGIANAFGCNLPFFGPALAELSKNLAALLLSCAAHLVSLPGTWQRCPTPSIFWVLAGIAVLFMWDLFEWRKFWLPCAGIAVLLLFLAYGRVPPFWLAIKSSICSALGNHVEIWKPGTPVLSLGFLDVGEGDCTIVRFPDSRIWAIDAGGIRQPASPEEGTFGFDVGEAVVSRYLWHEWVKRIDRIVVSHPDTDHAGGIPALINNFDVNRIEYSNSGSDALVAAITGTALKKKILTVRPFSGLEEKLGMVNVRVLNPPQAGRMFSSTNENSIVLELSFKRFSVLLTGDLEKAAEAELTYGGNLSQSVLLKVAHHGSRWGTSDSLLSRTQPRWAVISVGRNNPFGHPSEGTLKRLLQHRVKTMLTTDEGAIFFETDGDRYLIRTHLHGLLERGRL